MTAKTKTQEEYEFCETGFEGARDGGVYYPFYRHPVILSIIFTVLVYGMFLLLKGIFGVLNGK